MIIIVFIKYIFLEKRTTYWSQTQTTEKLVP